jgi:hypothetical protein
MSGSRTLIMLLALAGGDRDRAIYGPTEARLRACNPAAREIVIENAAPEN